MTEEGMLIKLPKNLELPPEKREGYVKETNLTMLLSFVSLLQSHSKNKGAVFRPSFFMKDLNSLRFEKRATKERLGPDFLS